jgi:hypothetical protein
MDEDQKDAAIGRVVREKKEAEHELALLQAEARKFGEMFLALGASLNASPEYITFERQEVDIRYHSPRGKQSSLQIGRDQRCTSHNADPRHPRVFASRC